MRTEPTYKGMTPPSTQNLKALDLWVFFLIYCSTFSFIPNVGFRLTLEYLTISPSSESLFSTLIHSPFERKHSQPEYITYDPSLVPPFKTIRKTFDTGLNCTRSGRKPTALIPLYGRIQGGKHRGDIRECGSSFLYVAQLSHSYPMWDLD